MYVYFNSVRVSDSYVSIIRRRDCINTTSGICHSENKWIRCIDTIISPDDGHIDVRHMYRIEINIHVKELFVKLAIYKDYNEMHGQQNIELWLLSII